MNYSSEQMKHNISTSKPAGKPLSGSIVLARGMSMSPYIVDGEYLEFDKDYKKIEVGDLVCLEDPRSPFDFIHRAVDKNKFKGDNHIMLDDALFKNLKIKGVVTHRFKKLDNNELKRISISKQSSQLVHRYQAYLSGFVLSKYRLRTYFANKILHIVSYSLRYFENKQ